MFYECFTQGSLSSLQIQINHFYIKSFMWNGVLNKAFVLMTFICQPKTTGLEIVWDKDFWINSGHVLKSDLKEKKKVHGKK